MLRIVISLTALVTPSRLVWMPVATVLTMLTSSRLRTVSVIVRQVFRFVVIHEIVMLLYSG